MTETTATVSAETAFEDILELGKKSSGIASFIEVAKSDGTLAIALTKEGDDSIASGRRRRYSPKRRAWTTAMSSRWSKRSKPSGRRIQVLSRTRSMTRSRRKRTTRLSRSARPRLRIGRRQCPKARSRTPARSIRSPKARSSSCSFLQITNSHSNVLERSMKHFRSHC